MYVNLLGASSTDKTVSRIDAPSAVCTFKQPALEAALKLNSSQVMSGSQKARSRS